MSTLLHLMADQGWSMVHIMYSKLLLKKVILVQQKNVEGTHFCKKCTVTIIVKHVCFILLIFTKKYTSLGVDWVK